MGCHENQMTRGIQSACHVISALFFHHHHPTRVLEHFMSPLCASVSPSAKRAFPGTHVAEFLSPVSTHTCKVLPRLQGLWSGQPGPTRRTRGGEGWGRHSALRGGGPPPNTRSPGERLAGERAWVEKPPRAPATGNPSSWQPGAVRLRLSWF